MSPNTENSNHSSQPVHPFFNHHQSPNKKVSAPSVPASLLLNLIAPNVAYCAYFLELRHFSSPTVMIPQPSLD